MYAGKQVVTVSKFKSGSLYNIGKEAVGDGYERKGTGNYDKDRLDFNYHYASMKEKNLYQEVKKRLADREIEYSKKEKTNMINGIVFTSGIEFFESLGMKLKDSGRIYQSGDKAGQKVFVPDINNKEAIPNEVQYYFDCCMEFLKKEVGEENIVLATVHYDEDTPHLQAYYLPIVNKVKRKVFEKDNNGNVIKKKTLNKAGKEIEVPKPVVDKNGKNIYETIEGKFLNDDQFWKSKGGANSYAMLQDSFNEFITDKGFNLYRGDKGATKEHETKIEWQTQEKLAELNNVKAELDFTNNQLELNKKAMHDLNNDYKEVLNPQKNKLKIYNSKDVENIIDYSKELVKQNAINENELFKQNNKIEKLTKENESFKNNKELKIRNDKIIEQQEIIKDQKYELQEKDLKISSLESMVNKLEKTLEKWKNKFFEVIDKIFGKELSNHEEDYLDYAHNFVNDRKYKDKSDDFEIGM